MSDIYFTSDIHFGHRNIIEYCNRPFNSVEEMDEGIIKKINARVKKGDRLYFLGDLSFYKMRDIHKMHDILSRINGQKFWIRGNHDYRDTVKELGQYFEWARDYYELKVDKQFIVLSHFPFSVWHRQHHGAWHLHGHTHGSYQGQGKILDVGIDSHPDFNIFSFDEVKSFMDSRSVYIADGHKPRTGDN